MRIKNFILGLVWAAVAVYMIWFSGVQYGGFWQKTFAVIAVLASGIYFYFALRKKK